MQASDRYISPGVLIKAWTRRGALGPRSIVAMMCASRTWHDELSADLMPLLQGHLEARAGGLVVADPTMELCAALLVNSYIRAPVLLEAVSALESAHWRPRGHAFRLSLRCLTNGSMWRWAPSTEDAGEYHRIVHTIVILAVVLNFSISLTRPTADFAKVPCTSTDTRVWALFAMYHFVGLAFAKGADETLWANSEVTSMLLNQLDEAETTDWSDTNTNMYTRLKWLFVRVRRKLLRRISSVESRGQTT